MYGHVLCDEIVQAIRAARITRSVHEFIVYKRICVEYLTVESNKYFSMWIRVSSGRCLHVEQYVHMQIAVLTAKRKFKFVHCNVFCWFTMLITKPKLVGCHEQPMNANRYRCKKKKKSQNETKKGLWVELRDWCEPNWMNKKWMNKMTKWFIWITVKCRRTTGTIEWNASLHKLKHRKFVNCQWIDIHAKRWFDRATATRENNNWDILRFRRRRLIDKARLVTRHAMPQWEHWID